MRCWCDCVSYYKGCGANVAGSTPLFMPWDAGWLWKHQVCHWLTSSTPILLSASSQWNEENSYKRHCPWKTDGVNKAVFLYDMQLFLCTLNMHQLMCDFYRPLPKKRVRTAATMIGLLCATHYCWAAENAGQWVKVVLFLFVLCFFIKTECRLESQLWKAEISTIKSQQLDSNSKSWISGIDENPCPPLQIYCSHFVPCGSKGLTHSSALWCFL